MQGSLILLWWSSLREKLNGPWGEWEIVPFPWHRVTCETLGAAVHILALGSQALQKKIQTKLGGNLGNKTREYICQWERSSLLPLSHVPQCQQNQSNFPFHFQTIVNRQLFCLFMGLIHYEK